MTAVGVLKDGPLLQRFAISGFRHGSRARQALQDSLDVWACRLGRQRREVEPNFVLRQIAVEIGNGLVKRDRKASFSVERSFFAHVDIHQNDASVGQPAQRALADFFELGVEILPEMLVAVRRCAPL